MSFGLSYEQSQEAGSICEELATSWRDLSAGSEGYLTGKGRRGLWKHKVVWGEQVGVIGTIRTSYVMDIVLILCDIDRIQWYVVPRYSSFHMSLSA